MKKRVIFLVTGGLCTVCIILLVVLFHQTKTMPGNDGISDETFSYEAYCNLFDTAAESLAIGEDFNQLIAEREDEPVIAIREDNSFGKRQYLTLDNAVSKKVTQRRLEYLSADGNYLVAIDFIYQSTPLENDLLYWYSPMSVAEDDFLQGKYDANLLAYRNILVYTSIFATGETSIDPTLLPNITSAVAAFLQS